MHAWVQAEGRQLFIVKGQQLMKRSFEPPVAVHPTNHGSVSMHAHAQQEGRDPRNVVMGKVKYGRKRTGLKESKRERETERAAAKTIGGLGEKTRQERCDEEGVEEHQSEIKRSRGLMDGRGEERKQPQAPRVCCTHHTVH